MSAPSPTPSASTSAPAPAPQAPQAPDDDNECPICCSVMMLPFTVPACQHVFCFACIKAISLRNLGGCPLCRAAIPRELFDRPKQQLDLKMELQDADASSSQMAIANPMYWLYEGRGNGWWRFDPRTEKDLETAFQTGVATADLMIMGRRYTVEFATMVQFQANGRRRNPQFDRAVKRVTADEFDQLDVKGVAGMFNG